MKKIILGIIIGVIISGTVGVIAATIVPSTIVTYQNKTVNNALDELYNEAITGKELVAAAITNKGVSTTSTDTYETMATNISSIDTDHTEINQKINNLESKHNSDVASLTGSISNLNQSLTWKLLADTTYKTINTINIPTSARELYIIFRYGVIGVNSQTIIPTLVLTDGIMDYNFGYNFSELDQMACTLRISKSIITSANLRLVSKGVSYDDCNIYVLWR